MKYKLIWRVNPQDRTKGKWYASPVNDGKITKTISALSCGDVSSVIENLSEIFPKYLPMGKSVSLGEPGTLRVSFGSEGVEEEKDFNVNKITSVKYRLHPRRRIKKTTGKHPFRDCNHRRHTMVIT